MRTNQAWSYLNYISYLALTLLYSQLEVTFWVVHIVPSSSIAIHNVCAGNELLFLFSGTFGSPGSLLTLPQGIFGSRLILLLKPNIEYELVMLYAKSINYIVNCMKVSNIWIMADNCLLAKISPFPLNNIILQ